MSDDEIIERGGTQEDINNYAHDVGGACGAVYDGTCDHPGCKFNTFDTKAREVLEAYAKNYTRRETGIVMGGVHLSLDQALIALSKAHEEEVNSTLRQLKAPDSLLEAHGAYHKITGLHNTFEYMGKEYDSCYACGFSPEAMNDEIDRLLNKGGSDE